MSTTTDFERLKERLADSAAVSDVEWHCHLARHLGPHWYDIERLTDNDPLSRRQVDDAIAYLRVRGLIEERDAGRYVRVPQLKEGAA